MVNSILFVSRLRRRRKYYSSSRSKGDQRMKRWKQTNASISCSLPNLSSLLCRWKWTIQLQTDRLLYAHPRERLLRRSDVFASNLAHSFLQMDAGFEDAPGNAPVSSPAVPGLRNSDRLDSTLWQFVKEHQDAEPVKFRCRDNLQSRSAYLSIHTTFTKVLSLASALPSSLSPGFKALVHLLTQYVCSAMITDIIWICLNSFQLRQMLNLSEWIPDQDTGSCSLLMVLLMYYVVLLFCVAIFMFLTSTSCWSFPLRM